jgi:hypothetical protein
MSSRHLFATFLLSTFALSGQAVITTLAGDPNGVCGYSGDGGPAAQAKLCRPQMGVMDGAGNYYLADDGNGAIRMISPSGIISTVAGNGTRGTSGDGGPATSANLGSIAQLAYDGGDRICFGDSLANKVRCLSLSTGIIQGYGSGIPSTYGDGGAYTNAGYRQPTGIAFVPGAQGSMDEYVLDAGDSVLRKIDGITGIITTVAGIMGNGAFVDGVPAASATFWHPWSLTYYNGSLYIADSGNNFVRQYNLATGMINRVLFGFNPPLSQPGQVTFDAAGTMYVTNRGNGLIVGYDITGLLVFSAGGGGCCGYGPDNVIPTQTWFSSLLGVLWNSFANQLVINDGNKVRAITYQPTTTTLTVSPNPANVGDQVTLTANFTSYAFGVVNFYLNSNLLGSVYPSAGQAIFHWTAVAGGGTVTAAFESQDRYTASSVSSPIAVTVQKIPTSTAIASAPNPSRVNQPVTISATVTPTASTGTVQFFNAGVTLGSVTATNGTATLTTSFQNSGATLLSASYSGDSTYAASASANLTQNVTVPTPTTTTLSSSLNPATLGSAITFLATVSPAGATGSIQFLDGTAVLGTIAMVSGSASFTTTSLALGSRSITAMYAGDTNNAASTSAVLSQSVKTAGYFSPQPNSSLLGQPLTLYVYMDASATPGIVTFTEGSTVLGTATPARGIAQFTISTLSLGAHTIAVSYSGDDSYLPASGTITASVRIASSATLSSSPNPSSSGQSVTFTVIVTPSAATGNVVFYDSTATTTNVIIGTVPVASGAASLSIATLSATTHFMTAVYSGDSSYTSSPPLPLTQVVKPVPTVSVVSSLNPSINGQQVSFSATLVPAAATGTIQFLDGGTVLGSAPVSAGAAAFLTSALSTGAHSITAIYSGDGTYGPAASTALSQTVNAKTVTTTTVTSSANPSSVGASVTFSASVSPSTATGTVQFLDGTTVLSAATLVSGGASFSSSTLTGGVHPITVAYAGDTINAASSSTVLSQSVRISAGLAVASAPNSPAAGQTITFTANLNAAATGTVQFLDGAAVLATVPVVSGAAAYSTAALTQGSHSMSAVYGGDATYFNSTTAFTQTVLAASSIVVVTSLSPSTAGQNVTFTATVTPLSATGTVQFLDGGVAIGTVPLVSGIASLSTASLASGSHAISAVYGGDAADAAATSVALTQIVKAVTTIGVASAPSPSVVGQAVSITATVTPTAATGTVQFLDGSSVLGTASVNSGTAVLNVATLAQGVHTLSVKYSGDANYGPSGSITITQNVNAKTATTTVVSSSQNPSVGGTVTLTAAVSGSAPTGTVQFLDGATALGTATLSNAVATLGPVTLATGTHPITAAYSGDVVNLSSTSAVLSQVVKLLAGFTVAVTPTPAVAGQQVTISTHVNAAATGTVTFTDGASVLATVSVTSGSASYSTLSLAAGIHSIGVSYSGDSTYISASTSFSETVLAVSSVVLQSNLNPASAGQSVTFTAVVTPSSATGTVQFLDGGALIGTAQVAAGAASFSTASLAGGLHSVTAAYSGDALNTQSSSNSLAERVKVVPIISLASSSNPSIVGHSVSFSASVTPATATGTIQFLDGTANLGTVTVSSGRAALATSQLAAGAHPITAVYSGDTTDSAAISAVLTQTVNVPPPSPASGLAATAAGSSQINLAWKASPTSEVSYDVYGSTSSGFTPSDSNRIASGIASTSYSATGLTASTTYYYRVTAVNAGGESAATNQATAKTTAILACHVTYAVTNQWNTGFEGAISIKNTGATSINPWTLTWTWAGNQSVTQSWNANYSQNGTSVTLTNESYNATIAAGATLTGVGFDASYSGSNPAPASFYINGTLCH